MAIATPSGWTQLHQQSTTFQWSAVFYKVANGSEGASVNVSLSGQGSNLAGAHNSYRITGYQGTPQVPTVATGTGTAPNPPSLSPSWGDDMTLWLALAATFSFGASMTVSSYPANHIGGISAQQTSAFPYARISSARRQNAAASEDPGTFSISSTGSWHAQTVGIRPT